MEDDDVNLSPSFSSPNPSSEGDHKNENETPRNSLQRGSRSLSLSSTILSSLGNNENESESNRNSIEKGSNSEHQSKQLSPKNFMAATISTASKSLSLKKKILAEWIETSPDAHLKKPSKNHGPKSIPPKIPSYTSPNSSLKCNLVDDETFVPDSSTLPYDPRTNYLSPRPKFLYYNPNRRREAIVVRQVEQGSTSGGSPSLSLQSQSFSKYSTAESCLKLQMDENGDSEEEVEEAVVEDEEEEEEEDMEMGERKWGLKWELFKALIVAVVLVFFTMYISSMNSPEPSLDMSGLKVEYQEFGNNSFRAVSLANIEFGNWIFDNVREESEMGLFEFSDIFVVSEGNSSMETIELSDNFEDQEVKLAGKIEFLENYYRNLSRFGNVDSPKPIPKSLEDDHEENEVPISIDQAHNQGIEEENLGSDPESNDGMIQEEILVGYEPNSKEGEMTNEVQFLAEAPYQEIEAEEVEFELKSKDEQLENEAKIACDDQSEIIEEDEFSDSKSKEEPELVENPIKEVEDENIFENGHKQLWLNLKNVFCFVIPLVMTWVASLVVGFYFKCKKASSKTISSNVKLSTKPLVKFEKSSSRLPPKSGEKITHTQKTNDPQLNPPPTVVVHSREEKLEKGSSRIIPKVEMLGEYVVGGEFRRRCDLESKIHEENEQSIHSFPEDSRRAIKAKAAPKMAYSSPPPNHSVLSKREFVEQDGTEELSKRMTQTPTTLRRSSRLRSKGVTSP